MANVMLVAGDDRTDPNKPFKMRIQELKDKYDDILISITSLLENRRGGTPDPNAHEELIKKINSFHLTCDQVFNEVHRRRQRILNHDEGELATNEANEQLQSAGNIAQVIGDFRRYLLTGEKNFAALSETSGGGGTSKSPAPFSSQS